MVYSYEEEYEKSCGVLTCFGYEKKNGVVKKTFCLRSGDDYWIGCGYLNWNGYLNGYGGWVGYGCGGWMGYGCGPLYGCGGWMGYGCGPLDYCYCINGDGMMEMENVTGES